MVKQRLDDHALFGGVEDKEFLQPFSERAAPVTTVHMFFPRLCRVWHRSLFRNGSNRFPLFWQTAGCGWSCPSWS